MELSQMENVYFIGIGGIGMSALARYLKYAGKTIIGYDKSPTQLTRKLQGEGINIDFEDNVLHIPKDFMKENTLVVVTPAVQKSHTEWKYFLQNSFTIKKRAEVLGMITKDTYCFAVAGTHGKTTTSSILGHILFEAGEDVTAFIGGIVENYDSNLIGNGTKITVVEADEFDRSFLQLHPNVVCITSMDADHLDIYGDRDSMETTFREFADKVEDKDRLFVAKGLPLCGKTIAVGEDADFNVFNIKMNSGEYLFDVQTPDGIIHDLRFKLLGRHNLSNALMALAMAWKFGISADQIREALISFKGIKRRFSYQIKTEKLVYIDDYAHHPTEIDAVHQAVRELYPSKKLLAIFQPHLFSRTKDFADDFAKSLSNFDEIFLLDIYPARELPMEGVTSGWLLSKIENPRKKLVMKADLIHEIMDNNPKVVVTIGAGDIGEMVLDIKEALLGQGSC
ncbi:uncharacterized protein DFL_005249 [Arthrobotrys flagrans]|uniref:UDP-N-acetylmuramate--L-alanine ligase n=1 Tax=Arthrobotrys flagrans TaxID=97331 RepID=A0A437A737_ARTFL|nr:hypothetical protein DFL_005249 [Arthrobotrys flagrans]